MTTKNDAKIYSNDCLTWLSNAPAESLHLSFLDPPFNQGKEYRHYDDKQNAEEYWQWMTDILVSLRKATALGGAVYFMQREKNAEFVLKALREAGWKFQNLIVWKKKSSAVPCKYKFGLQYQIIVSAINGNTPRAFNRLRISPPLPANYKYPRKDGMYLTDVWDDIRELTSGYFAGNEPIKGEDGKRFHKQQAPLALLVRIILSSSLAGDVVFDPFAGTGTTLVAASFLGRLGLGVEIDPVNVKCIKERIKSPRKTDIENILKLYNDYTYTENLKEIWGIDIEAYENLNKNISVDKQMTLSTA